MNTKNNKRYKSSSEKIETAFLTLLLNNKYEDIKISQICKQAEINRSTFYAHYYDINDLIIKIEQRFAHATASIFNFGLKADHSVFVDFFNFVKENRYFYKAFLSIPYATYAEKNTKNQVLENLKDNQSIGISNSTELYYRASFFGAGIKEICRLWLENNCKESPEQMAKMIYNEYTDRKNY